MMSFSLVFGQAVTGYVDTEDGPLVGANVVVEGTELGGVSDDEGKFVIETGSGNFDITGTVTVSSVAQFENVNITNNVVTTTESNSDLELRAAGTGEVIVPQNDVHITNDLIVDGTITVGDINDGDQMVKTSLYSQDQYNAVNAKTWASKVFIQN